MDKEYVDIEQVTRAIENELIAGHETCSCSGSKMSRQFRKNLEGKRMLFGWSISSEALVKQAVSEFVEDLIKQAQDNIKNNNRRL